MMKHDIPAILHMLYVCVTKQLEQLWIAVDQFSQILQCLILGLEQSDQHRVKLAEIGGAAECLRGSKKPFLLFFWESFLAVTSQLW